MLRLISAILFAFATSGVAIAAEKRVALVIGNGAYENADKLANPTTDSRAMRAALEKLNFSVVYGENLSKRETERAIGRFAEVVQNADVALTYYAGHGATFDAKPYIVPVDAKFEALSGMRYELVPLEDMISELRGAKGIRLAIVDACRDNSAEQALKRVASRGGGASRGLGRVETPDGLIVAYATQYNTIAADGTAGGNSPFTAALLKSLPTPGLDIKDVFFEASAQVVRDTNRQQRPEIAVSLYERYSLVPANAVTSPLTTKQPEIAPTSVVPPGPATDELAWSNIDRDSAEALRNFIRDFPGSARAGEARQRVASLQPARETPVPGTAAPAPVSPTVVPSASEQQSLRQICKLALNIGYTDWDKIKVNQPRVDRAKALNMSVGDCRKELGYPATIKEETDERLCSIGLTSDRKSWSKDPDTFHYVYAAEARFRKLSIDRCRTILGSN